MPSKSESRTRLLSFFTTFAAGTDTDSSRVGKQSGLLPSFNPETIDKEGASADEITFTFRTAVRTIAHRRSKGVPHLASKQECALDPN